jgi:hypothetical protein
MPKIWKTKKAYTSFLGVLLLMVFSISAMATTFQKMPLDKLIEDSHAAAEVSLKEKKSYMNKMGVIMTDYIFNLGESYNILDTDLEGEFLKVSLIGGSVDGVTSYIDGAPEFAVGEKAFLLLKKIESKIYISNFTMGKYKIEEVSGQKYYVSSVFPMDSDIGRVKKERMIEVIKTKFKQVNVPVEEKTVDAPALDMKNTSTIATNQEKRAPAQDEIADSNSGVSVMWGFFLLLIVSGFVIWRKLRQGVRE